jgi:outer membrane protein OmpA-like peptidoglycan-associated protein
MDERQPPPTRNSSRTLAKIAVAVLVVIAIAGIVLASLRGKGAPANTPVADATQTAAPAMTADPAVATAAAASAAAAEAAIGPNQVAFAPGSYELSEPATTKLVKLAETAVRLKRSVTITAKVEASRPDQVKLEELARSRAAAVRSVLEQNKVLLSRMTTRTASRAYGEATASELNRVDIDLK